MIGFLFDKQKQNLVLYTQKVAVVKLDLGMVRNDS